MSWSDFWSIISVYLDLRFLVSELLVPSSSESEESNSTTTSSVPLFLRPGASPILGGKPPGSTFTALFSMLALLVDSVIPALFACGALLLVSLFSDDRLRNVGLPLRRSSSSEEDALPLREYFCMVVFGSDFALKMGLPPRRSSSESEDDEELAILRKNDDLLRLCRTFISSSSLSSFFSSPASALTFLSVLICLGAFLLLALAAILSSNWASRFAPSPVGKGALPFPAAIFMSMIDLLKSITPFNVVPTTPLRFW
mmetsp:Transcript_9676/g.27122  ORF Transcript_9676/g.27122 Transcript_9676/m.27122 type:complete len:256 (+) Transcript_9676:410-1177(+)